MHLKSSDIVTIAFVFLVLILACLSNNEAKKHALIACGGHSTTIYAYGGNGGEAMVRAAARNLVIDPEQITNVHDAAIQAHMGTLANGQPIFVCFEAGDKRVAQVNDIGIHG